MAPEAGGDAGEHPVASCPDARGHLRAIERVDRLRRELADARARIEARVDTLSVQFDHVLDVLHRWGYVDAWSLTPRGALLAGVYHEADLAVAETIAAGCFDELDAPELAAVASVLVYEHRAPGPPPVARHPSGRVADRAREIDGIVARLNADEERVGLPITRGADHGFTRLAHEWCAGEGLGPLLDDADIDPVSYTHLTLPTIYSV